jgi:hypothetical protein
MRLAISLLGTEVFAIETGRPDDETGPGDCLAGEHSPGDSRRGLRLGFSSLPSTEYHDARDKDDD